MIERIKMAGKDGNSDGKFGQMKIREGRLDACKSGREMACGNKAGKEVGV